MFNIKIYSNLSDNSIFGLKKIIKTDSSKSRLSFLFEQQPMNKYILNIKIQEYQFTFNDFKISIPHPQNTA